MLKIKFCFFFFCNIWCIFECAYLRFIQNLCLKLIIKKKSHKTAFLIYDQLDGIITYVPEIQFMMLYKVHHHHHHQHHRTARVKNLRSWCAYCWWRYFYFNNAGIHIRQWSIIRKLLGFFFFVFKIDFNSIISFLL